MQLLTQRHLEVNLLKSGPETAIRTDFSSVITNECQDNALKQTNIKSITIIRKFIN